MLRYLLQHWLRQKASQAVHEKVLDTVRDELAHSSDTAQPDTTSCSDGEMFEGKSSESKSSESKSSESKSPDDTESPTEPSPIADIGIVFALGIESGGLEDLLQNTVIVQGHGFVAVRGTLRGHKVVVIRSGAGPDSATRATEALLEGHEPEWVLSAGFAGGLTDALVRHDLVMADSVIDTTGRCLAIDLKVDPEELARVPGVHLGRLITTDAPVRLPSEKRELGQKHQALAVDMESFAVAEACRRHHVRFLAVRIVSDPVDETLPPDIERLLEQPTKVAQLGAAIGAVWRRPASAKEMYQLRENALVASDRLAQFLESVIEQLGTLANH